MSKPAWLTTTPSSGSGNGTIANTATANTGRASRTGTVTVSGTDVATPATYTVTQSGKPEFVSFDNGASMSASKSGGTVTVTGVSNSSKLTFSWASGSPVDVSIPSSYTANSASTDNGTAITGDPGNSAQYAFSISFTFPENTTIDAITRSLTVTPNSGSGDAVTIAIEQAAGDPYCTVSPDTITIDWAGTPAVNVTVSSNTSWTVS